MSFKDLEAGRGKKSLASLMSINGGVGGGRQDKTQAVASGVFQINTGVSSFHRLVNTLGTSKDTPELRDKLHLTRLHIGRLVKDTSAKLKEANETYHLRGVVDQRKKIVDLAKDFQAVLNEFLKAQGVAAERETVYSPHVHKPSLPSSYTASKADVKAEKDPEQQALLLESKRQELALLNKMIAFNVPRIEEREQLIQEIQQSIGEMGETLKNMAVVVHDEEAMIDEIKPRIDNYHAAIAQGNSHRSYSSLACLLLVTFGIVLLIVIVVLAV
ncbi:PREDICTED: syntaxin-23-like [Camelina sativa]|uniref:Syntaxin-23-like n=1 Tax=Camelina sativa TaxID=90675 RepID=A0ABM0U1W7_CAMSA|nr:PREDICTED: syntaxin-23-like [Camelina sativa]